MKENKNKLCHKCRKGIIKKQKIGYCKHDGIIIDYTCTYCKISYFDYEKINIPISKIKENSFF